MRNVSFANVGSRRRCLCGSMRYKRSMHRRVADQGPRTSPRARGAGWQPGAEALSTSPAPHWLEAHFPQCWPSPGGVRITNGPEVAPLGSSYVVVVRWVAPARARSLFTTTASAFYPVRILGPDPESRLVSAREPLLAPTPARASASLGVGTRPRSGDAAGLPKYRITFACSRVRSRHPRFYLERAPGEAARDPQYVLHALRRGFASKIR
jgi:hypothetical protein